MDFHIGEAVHLFAGKIVFRHKAAAVEDVPVRLHVLFRRADVNPVFSAGVDGDFHAPLQQGGEGFLFYGNDLPGRNQVEDAGLKDIDARVDEVRLRLAGLRLFGKRGCEPVGAELDDPVAGGVRHAGDGDGRVRALLFVVGHEGPEVDVAQNVGVEDEEGPVQIFLAVFDCPAGSERDILADIRDFDAVDMPGLKMAGDAVRFVAGAEDDLPHAAAL